MRFTIALLASVVPSIATAKKAHPFQAQVTVFSNEDCTGTNQTITAVVEGCENADFDFASAIVQVKPRYRHHIANYSLFYWNGEDCSLPNRQGYLRGALTVKPVCQYAGSDSGVDRSIAILRSNETGEL